MEGDTEREVLSTWREWVYEREMEEEIEREARSTWREWVYERERLRER